MNGCGQCGELTQLCMNCHNCGEHCGCPTWWETEDVFDADELGLDPETDNTPLTEERHA